MEDKNTQQQRVCPKDCRRCNMAQQIFCSTSLTFNSYEVMKVLWERLIDIERKIDSLQNGDSEFMSPVTNDKVVTDTITGKSRITRLESE